MEYDISVTGIIKKDNKFLIVKRSINSKHFPNKWTVPGGKIEVLDYINKKSDNEGQWYEILEKALRREILEEINIEIFNIKYLTNIVFIKSENKHSLVISFHCECDNLDNIKLSNELSDYKLVTLKEAKKYDLIEGIYNELKMVNKNG